MHVVQACHLDVGFSDLAINVINKYFDSYFPEAITTATQLANDTSTEAGLIFTTQSWLVSLYLDCPTNGFPVPPGRTEGADPGGQAPTQCNCSASPAARKDCGHPGISPGNCTAKGCCWDASVGPHTVPWCFFPGSGPAKGPCAAPAPKLHCPTPQSQAAMRAALVAGYIVFHAFPFNAEPELLDREMFDWGLQLSKKVAENVRITAPTVMSQRDVPSMTRFRRAAASLTSRAAALQRTVALSTTTRSLRGWRRLLT